MPSYSCLPAAVLDKLRRNPTMAKGGSGRDLLGVPVCNWSLADLADRTVEVCTGSRLATDAAASGTSVEPPNMHGLGVFAAREISKG